MMESWRALENRGEALRPELLVEHVDELLRPVVHVRELTALRPPVLSKHRIVIFLLVVLRLQLPILLVYRRLWRTARRSERAEAGRHGAGHPGAQQQPLGGQERGAGAVGARELMLHEVVALLAAPAVVAVDERQRPPRDPVHEPAPLHEEVLEVVAGQGEEAAQPPARRRAGGAPARMILHVRSCAEACASLGFLREPLHVCVR